MKPTIKRQAHYCLLLMRDDSEVHNYRVTNMMLRAFFICLTLIIMCGIGGVAIGAHYWKKTTTLTARQPILERELAESKLKLEQLTNESALWRNAKGATPAPTPKNEEVGATPPQSVAEKTNGGAVPSNILAPLQSPAVNATGTNATANKDLSKQPASSANANATEVVSVNNAPTPISSASPSSPIRISGFSARPSAPQQMRIRFSLVSADQQQVSGMVKYTARLFTGKSVELSPAMPGHAKFNISRQRPFEAQVKLPSPLAAKEIEQIEIAIVTDSGQHIIDSFAAR